jgi:hypothetical protein
MDTEKMIINADKDVTVTILEGKVAEPLEIKPPVITNLLGDITAPANFLQSRAYTLNQDECIVLCRRDDGEIYLIINEKDPYSRGTIKGVMEVAQITRRIGVNIGKKWAPADLSQLFKMTRAYFPDREENMKLVTVLKNFQANINQRLEKMKNENGSFSDVVSAEVTSNIPAAFTIEAPIWKGGQAVKFTVEIYSTIDGKNIQLELWSPALEEIMETTKDQVINGEIDRIKAIWPHIAIIEQ